MTRVVPKLGRNNHRAPESAVKGMRRALFRAAKRRETVAYGTLMKAFGLSRGRTLSRAIAEVDREEYIIGAPGFAAIIVRKDTGYPGGGYFCDDTLPINLRRSRSRANDPRLSPAERGHINSKQKEIWGYYARKKLSGRS